MKRLIIILSIVLLVILLAGAVAWWRLPSIAIFLMGRAIGGQIEARHSTVSWNGRAATVELNDVSLSGDVQGTVKRVRLDLKPGRGIYIKRGLVSDFDVVIKKEKTSGRFLPFQVEYAEVTRGRAVYKGQTFTINSIKISNFNTSGPFEFSLDGGIEGFGKIKTHGGGIWRNGRSDISGTYQIADFDLGHLFRGYEGRSDSKGRLNYRNGEWGLHGAAGANGFVMREDFLKKPISIPRVDCLIDIETSGGKIRTRLNQLSFKGTPVQITFTNAGRRLDAIELSSGPLDVGDIQEYLSLSFVKRLPVVMDAVSAGKVAIRELVLERPHKFKALLSLEDVEAHYKEFRFEGISGDLRLDRDKIVLTRISATWGNSLVTNVSGSVPFSLNKDIRVSAKYELDLADISHFIESPAVRVTSGSAEGVVEIRGKKEEDMRVTGAGTLKAAVSLKNLLLWASGSYTFDRNGINCNPFTVKNDSTELHVSGRISRDTMDLKIHGLIDGADAGRIYAFPYPLGGSAEVDGRLECKDGYLSWQGTVSMDALSFEVPGFLSKKVGVPSSAVVQLRFGKEDLYVDKVDYALSAVHVQVTGQVSRNLASNLRVKVNTSDLGQASDSVGLNGNKAKGEVRADVQIGDFRYPISRLPLIKGYVTVRNGYLALPFLAKPIEGMDLTCALAGDRYEITTTNLRAGTSAIKRATLIIQGTERPRVAMRVTAARLDMDDLFNNRGKPWRIHSIEPHSLLSRISGEVLLEAKQVRWGRADLAEFDAKLRFADGKLTLEDGKAGLFGGVAHAAGSADLAGHQPQFRLTGGVERISWAEMFGTIKGDAEIMKGTGMVKAELQSQGENEGEIIETLSGRITATSTNGVIRKWNLLSKIFGLLNLYELFQGKVNLAEDGLPYTVMSADFSGQNGLFETRNFVIDSPSMFISGRGSIALRDGTLEGRIAVSPLVTIDKLLDRIPIIRNLLREKKEGFLFFVYNVSGPFRDPDIYSTYVETIGMRAYRILRNLIRLPKEVFE